MRKLAVIVEGTGDASAIGSIIHRSLNFLGISGIVVSNPMSVKGCSNMDRNDGLERFVALASRDADVVLILRDNDVLDGAVGRAHAYSQRLRKCGVIVPVAVVVAVKEVENWFIASLESIAGKKLGFEEGIPEGVPLPQDAERLSGKGFFNQHLPRGYKESVHQRLIAAKFEPELAYGRSCSFGVLCRRLQQLEKSLGAAQPEIFP